jgi:hypothetical protein
VDQPYSSLRTYYGRIYEAKFITGAIAGAMANEDRIGYIASYPIFGVTASINAFALGAQMTNPRAQIELRWSCVEGTPQADFFEDGIRVVSNRNAPTLSCGQDFCNYGTYLMDSRGDLIPLGTPLWVWGNFYEFVIRSILSGGWKREKGDSTALNYWLGMDSGVIDVQLSEKLPEGVRQMALLLKKSLREGTLDPFCRKIIAQDGSVKNDGTRKIPPEELLRMDWLCENVVGKIPSFEEILSACRGRAAMNIQIYAKSEKVLREICRLYKKYDMYDHGYFTIYPDLIEPVRSIDPDIELCTTRGWETRTEPANLRLCRETDRCRFCQPVKEYCSAETFQLLRELGLRGNVFFADTAEDLTTLIALGAQGVLTNKAHLACEVRKNLFIN